MKALKKVQATWYTPPDEEGEEKPARFKVKPLTPSEYEAVAKFVDGYMRIPPESWDRALKTAVTDWENLEGDEGPIPFGIQHFDRIPEPVRLDLIMHIVSTSDLSGEEKKT